MSDGRRFSDIFSASTAELINLAKFVKQIGGTELPIQVIIDICGRLRWNLLRIRQEMEIFTAQGQSERGFIHLDLYDIRRLIEVLKETGILERIVDYGSTIGFKIKIDDLPSLDREIFRSAGYDDEDLKTLLAVAESALNEENLSYDQILTLLQDIGSEERELILDDTAGSLRFWKVLKILGLYSSGGLLLGTNVLGAYNVVVAPMGILPALTSCTMGTGMIASARINHLELD